MLGFLGPNGAGKTTAMRAVFGLVEPDAGKVRWNGLPIGLAERLRFGYMPEERGLYPRMPVGENSPTSVSCTGSTARLRARRAADWLNRLDLAGRADAKLEELSHGNQQRASLPPRCCTGRSCLSSTSPSPASTRSRCRRSPTSSEARRRAARPCSSQATNSTSSRTSARTSRSSTTAASSLPASSTRSDAPHTSDGSSCNSKARSGVAAGIDGVELVERRNGDLRLLASQAVDPEQVLTEAERAGRVIAFSYGPPSLAELFLELVAG